MGAGLYTSQCTLERGAFSGQMNSTKTFPAFPLSWVPCAVPSLHNCVWQQAEGRGD